MYSLKDNGVIGEVTFGNNFEYVLEDNSHFVKTDYKVLQSQTNGIFVQCMKIMRNGRTDLCYLTSKYRSLSSMFSNITADTLITIATNLLASVIEVRSNGFLACQCIDLSWDKIFVEPSTLKVKLVYLPLSVKMFESYSEFESELRSGLFKLINTLNIDMSERLSQFGQDLCNGSLPIEDVYSRIKQGAGSVTGVSPYTEMPEAEEPLKLVALNLPGHFEIVLDRDDLLIGKVQELVDRVITFNNAISRKHCRIVHVNGGYFISDEGSMNGTFVNGSKVLPGQCCRINKGDIISLANSDFQIM